jgi:2-C-methyl-D-erythritol 4-phosphate cytidylyltransferase
VNSLLLQKLALIVAGGRGKRLGTQLPKQFVEVHHKPLLYYSLSAFRQYDNEIPLILVLPKEYFSQWKKLTEKYNLSFNPQLVKGGDSRFQSVKNGLDTLPDEGLVAVHDAARPLVSPDLIARGFKAAQQQGSSVPVVPVKSSLRKVTRQGSQSVVRGQYKIVQTPQTFKLDILKAAYRQKENSNFTDEATVIESNGGKVSLIEGENANIKVTYPLDLDIVKAYLDEARK